MIPVLRTRPHVTLTGLRAAGFRILAALDGLCRHLGKDIWITSGTDGNRLPTDPHKTGEAIDFSIIGRFDTPMDDFTTEDILESKRFLEDYLGPAFTVLYEAPSYPVDPRLRAIVYLNAKASAPHFHVQRKRNTVFPPAVENQE
jgi:hypothetical protein